MAAPPPDAPAVPHTASLYLSSLHGNSVPLDVEDVTSVYLMVDSGGSPISSAEATITFSLEQTELVAVNTGGAVCEQGQRLSTLEPGVLVLECDFSGAAFNGVVSLAELSVRAIAVGLATLSVSPESVVIASEEGIDVLGHTGGTALAIGIPVPPIFYPEPVVYVPSDSGQPVLITALVIGGLIAVALVSAGLVVQLVRRRRAKKEAELLSKRVPSKRPRKRRSNKRPGASTTGPRRKRET